MHKKISIVAVLVLLVISAYVAFGQYMKWNMWIFISLYWTVLSIKNYADLKDIRGKNTHQNDKERNKKGG